MTKAKLIDLVKEGKLFYVGYEDREQCVVTVRMNDRFCFLYFLDEDDVLSDLELAGIIDLKKEQLYLKADVKDRLDLRDAFTIETIRRQFQKAAEENIIDLFRQTVFLEEADVETTDAAIWMYLNDKEDVGIVFVNEIGPFLMIEYLEDERTAVDQYVADEIENNYDHYRSEYQRVMKIRNMLDRLKKYRATPFLMKKDLLDALKWKETVIVDIDGYEMTMTANKLRKAFSESNELILKSIDKDYEQFVQKFGKDRFRLKDIRVVKEKGKVIYDRSRYVQYCIDDVDVKELRTLGIVGTGTGNMLKDPKLDRFYVLTGSLVLENWFNEDMKIVTGNNFKEGTEFEKCKQYMLLIPCKELDKLLLSEFDYRIINEQV